MTSRFAKFLAVALLFGVTRWASAALPAVDIFSAPGVPGTGGYSTVMGPCYCDQPALFSDILLLEPGTYDFGEVRDYWVQSGYTPDGGPDQANLYLLFSPVEVSGFFPDDFPPPATYAYPTGALCDQHDDACNASFQGAYQDFDLVYTVSPGQNALQIGLIGSFVYSSPLPEPLTLATLIIGLALIAGVSKARRRGRRVAVS